MVFVQFKGNEMKLTDIRNSLNEISAIGGLKQVVKGNTDRVEGIKLSKEMAQAMIDWFNSSPYGRKYPKAAKARLHLSLGIMMSFGLDRYAKFKGAKEELKYIKDLSKAMRDNVNEESLNEGKFKVDDLVYNKRTKTVGIVRIGDDKSGEVKTDADGNVDVDELEKYNPIKFKHQSKAKAAPSTQKEVSKRGLFNPFKSESLNEGKYDDLLDNLADIVGNAKSFMDIGKELKSNKIKYSFGTSPLPMYIIDKPVKIAILNNKYADGAERVVGDTAIGLMESLSEEAHDKATLDTIARRMFGKSYSRLTMDQAARVKASLREVIEEGSSMKLTDIINESKYTVINPKNGNVMGAGLKDQAAKLSKKMGGEKKGYYVIPMSNAKKARRALEKHNFDLKNQKLHSMLGDLYYESADESMNEGASSEEKRIVMLAVRKIAKYRNVDIKTAAGDVYRAAMELERDIEKGRVKK